MYAHDNQECPHIRFENNEQVLVYGVCQVSQLNFRFDYSINFRKGFVVSVTHQVVNSDIYHRSFIKVLGSLGIIDFPIHYKPRNMFILKKTYTVLIKSVI